LWGLALSGCRLGSILRSVIRTLLLLLAVWLLLLWLWLLLLAALAAPLGCTSRGFAI
jgi:hypothetical protein